MSGDRRVLRVTGVTPATFCSAWLRVTAACAAGRAGMTVALVLAGGPDAGLYGQLAALGVRRVDAADRTGPGLLTLAAAARAAGERVLIYVGEDAVPEQVLVRLLDAGGTAGFTGAGAR